MKLTTENVFTKIYLPKANEIQILSTISQVIANKLNIDEQEIKSGFLAREAAGSTAFGGKVAIPHANSSDIDEPIAFVLTFDDDIDWRSKDDQPVNVVIALIMPRNSHEKDYHYIVKDLRDDLANPAIVDKFQDSLDDPDSLVELVEDSIAQKVNN